MNKQKTSISERSKKPDSVLGSFGLRHKDSWKKCGEGFDGIPLERSAQTRKSLLGESANEEKEIATFSSDSDEETASLILPQRPNRKRKRESKQRFVKQLYVPQPLIKDNDDINIVNFSPSKLSGSSAKQSKRVPQIFDDEDIEIKTDEIDSQPGPSSLAVVETNISQQSGAGEILDYSSSEEQDSILNRDDNFNEIIAEGEELDAQKATSDNGSTAPSRGVLQRLKLDSVASENEDPPRLDDPSPKKRPKYIKGQLADRLAKMVSREASEVAFWKHKVSKKLLKEDAAKNMTLKVLNSSTSLSLTFAKCKVLEDNREDSSVRDTVTILLNKEQAQSLKVGKNQVLRVYPPWQEITVANGETLLLCGRFCQVIKPAESTDHITQRPESDPITADSSLTYRWVYQVEER